MKPTWFSNIDHPLVKPGVPGFELPRWPPPKDWPVSVNRDGIVVSRVDDDVYDYSAYAKRGLCVHFSDERLTPINRRRYKRVVCWWQWGSRGRVTAQTISTYAAIIKPLFLAASARGLDVSEFADMPQAAQLLAPSLGTSTFDVFLMLLDELHTHRGELGFRLLDRKALTDLTRLMPKHELQQTPYIPPRIWLYQVTRLKACVDDFAQHKDALVGLFNYCLRSYVENYGSIEAACHPDSSRRHGPFNSDVSNPHTYHGSFYDVAERYGVNQLFSRWLRPESGKAVDERLVGIQRLSSYFNLVQAASMMHLLNLTAMRGLEAKDLRLSCFVTEEHEELGEVCLVRGSTEKTIREEETYWVTSPSVKASVEVLACIARLRMSVATKDPNVHLTKRDIDDPLLFTPGYEPWASISDAIRSRGPDARQRLQYGAFTERFPALFDSRELTITEEDLNVARLITPTLDPDLFKIGSIWPLAAHQLRRTAAVNMVASGLVDIRSLQYQLKHLTRMQSLYYGRGFSKLHLSQRAIEEFVRTTYEMLALQADQLSDNRYLSPLGPENKQRILRFVEDIDPKDRLKAAKRGQFSLRPTLLGLCAKCGPCPHGGIDNVARCVRCADALVDCKKLPDIKLLQRSVKSHIAAASPGSPRKRSLKAQQTSLMTARRLIESTET